MLLVILLYYEKQLCFRNISIKKKGAVCFLGNSAFAIETILAYAFLLCQRKSISFDD